MAESKARLLRVRAWDQLYENNRSRELGTTTWFPIPNDLSAYGYVELIAHSEGPAHFGVWNSLLMVASKAKPRGLLIREDGRPHTPESLARVTRFPQQLIEACITRLLAIGLLETDSDKPRNKSRLRSHPDAAIRQSGATTSRKGAVEGNGTEHHHQEGNRTEKKGTERAREKLETEDSRAAVSAAAASSQSGDDADENAVEYASPEDELKAIYLTKAGEPIATDLLHVIRANLELTRVPFSEFVAEARKHYANRWKNPPGFLRDLSKRFHAKTRRASEPLTVAEAIEKDYRCPLCHSRTRGAGAVPGEREKLIPCACASPEWIERQRARGVFEAESDQ